MKVGLVELAFHNEVLRSYINILKELSNEIVCFTNKFCHEQIYDYRDDPEVDWSIKKEGSNKLYFEQVHDQLKSCDVVIIITLDDDLDFFAEYKWPTKTILLIHDYYSFFEQNQINYSGTLKDKARSTKSWLQFHTKKERKKISKLIHNMTKLAVPSRSVMKFIQDRNPTQKLTEILDFAIPNQRYDVPKDETVVITIPGNVIPKSRNYRAVVNALSRVKEDIQKIELVILGQARTSYGRKIIHELDKLSSEQIAIKYYDKFIDQEEFDEQLKRTDFLLLPISKVMRYRHFKEMNGFTCVSGNINDMLYFGKPAIIPSFYPLDEPVENMVERYKTDDHLGTLMIDWVNNRKFDMIKSKILSIQNSQRKIVEERFRKAIS